MSAGLSRLGLLRLGWSATVEIVAFRADRDTILDMVGGLGIRDVPDVYAVLAYLVTATPTVLLSAFDTGISSQTLRIEGRALDQCASYSLHHGKAHYICEMQIRGQEERLPRFVPDSDHPSHRGWETIHLNVARSRPISEVESGPSPTQLAGVTDCEAKAAPNPSHYPGNAPTNPSEGSSQKHGSKAEYPA